MPEGTVDVTVSAAMGSRPVRAGSVERSAFVVPQICAEWSNGLFIEGLAIGMKLSDDPLLQYGPVASLNFGVQRADSSGHGIRPVLGAFVNYTPFNELTLQAYALAPAGRDGRGVWLHTRAGTWTALVPRQTLAVGVGVNLADAAYMQSMFGAAGYRPSGGVHDVYADVSWRWQISRKYTLTAALQASVLQGSAAASPRVVQRTGVTSWLALGYSF